MTISAPPTRPAPAPVGTDLALLARRELAATPMGDLGATVEILDRLDRLRSVGDRLRRGLEALTALSSSQLLILGALESGLAHPRHVGRAVGMDTAAVEATVPGLVDKGLVVSALDPAARMTSLHLTDAGQALLTQAEAVQIRVTDALLQQAGPDGVSEVLDLLDRAVDRIDALTGLLPADGVPGAC